MDAFERLLVWQKAHALMLFIHRAVVPLLPLEEKWDLTKQLRRSSKSISANVAEGHGRFHFRENIHFQYIARGSLSETKNHLHAARDLQYIPCEIFEQGREKIDEVYRLRHGYIDYLKRKRPGEGEPSD
jgi:four helix bundle protein